MLCFKKHCVFMLILYYLYYFEKSEVIDLVSEDDGEDDGEYDGEDDGVSNVAVSKVAVSKVAVRKHDHLREDALLFTHHLSSMSGQQKQKQMPCLTCDKKTTYFCVGCSVLMYKYVPLCRNNTCKPEYHLSNLSIQPIEFL